MSEYEKLIKDFNKSITVLEEYKTMIGTAISCLKGEVIIPEEDGTVESAVDCYDGLGEDINSLIKNIITDFGHLNIKQLKEEIKL